MISRLLLASILIYIVEAYADPIAADRPNKQTFDSLVSEKASLMDIGLLRLEIAINQVNLYSLEYRENFNKYSDYITNRQAPFDKQELDRLMFLAF